jgi:hypothetical protein
MDRHSTHFAEVYNKLVDLIRDENGEACSNSGSCLYPIQAQNRSVLLSLVQALSGRAGDVMRIYVESFLDAEPTNIVASNI